MKRNECYILIFVLSRFDILVIVAASTVVLGLCILRLTVNEQVWSGRRVLNETATLNQTLLMV